MYRRRRPPGHACRPTRGVLKDTHRVLQVVLSLKETREFWEKGGSVLCVDPERVKVYPPPARKEERCRIGS